MKNIFTTVMLALFVYGAMAQDYRVQVKAGKLWGYANQEGDLVIPPKYKKCFAFSEGYAAVLEGKKYMFINADGAKLDTEIDGFVLTKTSSFSDGLVPIRMGKNWGYMNTEGKMVINAKYIHVTPFEKGYAIVKLGTEFIIIDKEGEETKIEVPNIKSVKQFSEGLAPLYTTNGTVGFINTDGKLVIDARFYGAGYFVNGRAWVKNLTKQLGYINTAGEWVIDPKFMAGKNFDQKSEMARVKYNDQWAYVTREGDIKYVKNTSVWGDFYDGLAKGRVGELVGFYDNTGTYVIKPEFQAVRNFKNGFAAAKLKDKWGMINTEGEWIIEPKLDGIKDMQL